MAECEERLPIGAEIELEIQAAARSAPKCAGFWDGGSAQ